jgi:hypothetical protein
MNNEVARAVAVVSVRQLLLGKKHRSNYTVDGINSLMCALRRNLEPRPRASDDLTTELGAKYLQGFSCTPSSPRSKCKYGGIDPGRIE